MLSGGNDEDKLQYEYNARNQITLWGPEGQIIDYAGMFEVFQVIEKDAFINNYGPLSLSHENQQSK